MRHRQLLLILVMVLFTGSCSRIVTNSKNEEQQDPNLGKVTGVLFSKWVDKDTEEPMVDTVLYLTEILTDEKGQPAVAAMNRNDSNSTRTDQDGNFVFYNVKPGYYGIVIDKIVKLFLLTKPGTNVSLMFDVKAGDTMDLGVLSYTREPGE